jgi:hypothetical protein
MTTGFTAILAAGMVLSLTARAAEFRSVTVDVFSDDNVTRAAPAGDKVSATGVSGSYASGQSRQVSDSARVVTNYDLGANLYPSVSGLNSLLGGGAIKYHNKMGLGPTAPWWSAAGRGGYELFVSDSDRSNLFASADLRLGKRFGEAFNLTGNLAYDMEKASGEAYSISGTSYGLMLDYSFGQQWLVYYNYSQRTGDITTVASVAPGGSYVKKSQTDRTFGGWAYLIDVKSTIQRYGINYAIDDASSIDFSFEDYSAQGSTDPTYWYYKKVYKLAYVRNL